MSIYGEFSIVYIYYITVINYIVDVLIHDARYYLFEARITNRNKFKIQGINKIFNKLVETLKAYKNLKKYFSIYVKILYNTVS